MYDQVTSTPQLMSYVADLLVVDIRSSLAYSTMTHPLPVYVASKLPVKI